MLGGSNNSEDRNAYPDMLPLPAPIAIPAGGVGVGAGQDLQNAVDSHPGGTQFNLAEGTWTGNQNIITPKAGDSFYGIAAGRTILKGIAIRGNGIDNVTIANLTISEYTADEHGTIDSDFDHAASSGWKILNVETTRNNHGFTVGGNSLIENVLSHHNNTNGGGGGGKSGTIYRYSAFIYNNRVGADDPNASHAGSKSGVVENAEIRGNYFADNGQSGYWCDVTCKNNHWIDNISVRNSGAGFFTEIDGGGNLIENNIALGNGWRNYDWQDDGILVSSSHDDEVRNNIVLRSTYGSIVLWCDSSRGNQCGNNKIYGNTIDSDVINNSDPGSSIHDNTIVPANQVQVPQKAAGPQM
jgi:parallel beta-helix repeat protein